MFGQKFKSVPQVIFFQSQLLAFTSKKVSKESYFFIDFLDSFDHHTASLE
jgi:hypothetical protein